MTPPTVKACSVRALMDLKALTSICSKHQLKISEQSSLQLIDTLIRKLGTETSQRLTEHMSENENWTEEEHEVEAILDCKDDEDDERLYLVKWKGWDHSHNTWEPSDNLLNSLELVTEWNKKHLKEKLLGCKIVEDDDDKSRGKRDTDADDSRSGKTGGSHKSTNVNKININNSHNDDDDGKVFNGFAFTCIQNVNNNNNAKNEVDVCDINCDDNNNNVIFLRRSQRLNCFFNNKNRKTNKNNNNNNFNSYFNNIHKDNNNNNNNYNNNEIQHRKNKPLRRKMSYTYAYAKSQNRVRRKIYAENQASKLDIITSYLFSHYDDQLLWRLVIAMDELKLVGRDYFKTCCFLNLSKKLNKLSKLHKEYRQEMMNVLKTWETEINSKCPTAAAIKVENDVDFEGPPDNFIFTPENIISSDVLLSLDDLFDGCQCLNGKCCKDRKSCTCMLKLENKIPAVVCPAIHGRFLYNSNGLLNQLQVGVPIYECNKRCSCSQDCSNRVVQKGRKYELAIFRTDDGRGWGVKTLQNIPKGAFVEEYVGEVITTEEAERRGQQDNSEGLTYLFDLDFYSRDCAYTIDAKTYGNVSHFINHSCDPNLAIFNVWIDNLDQRLPRIALFAVKDIKLGEEITFDYNIVIDDDEDDSSFATALTSQSTSVLPSNFNPSIESCVKSETDNLIYNDGDNSSVAHFYSCQDDSFDVSDDSSTFKAKRQKIITSSLTHHRLSPISSRVEFLPLSIANMKILQKDSHDDDVDAGGNGHTNDDNNHNDNNDDDGSGNDNKNEIEEISCRALRSNRHKHRLSSGNVSRMNNRNNNTNNKNTTNTNNNNNNNSYKLPPVPLFECPPNPFLPPPSPPSSSSSITFKAETYVKPKRLRVPCMCKSSNCRKFIY